MENVRNFIDLVALGDNAAARDELDKILSQKSFDSLDERKHQIAGAIFGTTEEPELDLDNAVAELEDEEAYAEDVEYDGDQLDEVSMKLATSVYKSRKLDAEDETAGYPSSSGQKRNEPYTKSGKHKMNISRDKILSKPGGARRVGRIDSITE